MEPSRLVARSLTPEWYQARKYGVSATTVARAAAGPGGFESELQRALYPEQHIVEDNAYMRFGRDYEQYIIDRLPKEFGIVANDWLVRAEAPEHRWHLATPDGNNDDWSMIAEVKTTGKDWSDDVIPIQYRRQVQWQMHVTGAKSTLFAWLLRGTDEAGEFIPAWDDPKWVVIYRDETMIESLIDTAQRFIEAYNAHREMEDF